MRAPIPNNHNFKTGKSNGLTPAEDILEAKRIFVAEYSKRANVGDACRAAGIARRNFFRWKDSDVYFNQAVNEAEQAAYDIMEREAHRRAFEGTSMPAINKDGVVFHPLTGEQVFITQYSDFLADKLLKANRPDKFGTKLEVRHTEVGRASDHDILEQLGKQGVFLKTSGPKTIEGVVARDVESIEGKDTREDNPYLDNNPWWSEVPEALPDRVDDNLLTKVAPITPKPPPPPRIVPTTDYPPEGIEGIDW